MTAVVARRSSPPVVPGTPEWEELVEIGIRAVNANWDLGDAVLRIVPMGEDRANSGALENLKLYGDRTGIEFETLLRVRGVAHAFEHRTRVLSTPWSAHRALQAHPELVRPDLTYREAVRVAKEADREQAAADRTATAGIPSASARTRPNCAGCGDSVPKTQVFPHEGESYCLTCYRELMPVREYGVKITPEDMVAAADNPEMTCTPAIRTGVQEMIDQMRTMYTECGRPFTAGEREALILFALDIQEECRG